MSGLAATPARSPETSSTPLPVSSRFGWSPERAADLRYLIFGRVIPASLYALLGYAVLRNIHASAGGWLAVLGGPVRNSLYAAFCLIPVVLFVIRPRPRATDHRALPRVLAFAATTMLLLLGTPFLPALTRLVVMPAWVGGVCSMVLLIATAGEVWALLTLGLSFGIFPAARDLVTGGPYRLVRHPLYLFEILGALAIVIPGAQLAPLLLVAAFCAMQARRLGYEEALLRRTLPEWAAWAGGRARLVPGLW